MKTWKHEIEAAGDVYQRPQLPDLCGAAFSSLHSRHFGVTMLAAWQGVFKAVLGNNSASRRESCKRICSYLVFLNLVLLL
jgi:hypothetical protein